MKSDFIPALLNLVILTCLLSSGTSQAEISHYDMKGVHDLIAPDYEYLSPIHGFTLLGTKTLENRRFYGSYGPEKEGHDCLDPKSQIGKLLRENKDCPQDSMSELVQRLFPAQDGINFVANQIDSDIVSHLDAETIGRLLGRVSKIKDDNSLATPEGGARLQSDLKKILFESLNPKKFFEAEKRELQQQIKTCKKDQSDLKNELTAKLNEIQIILQRFDSSSDSRSESTSEEGSGRGLPLAFMKEGKGKEKDFEQLARILVQALKESNAEAYPTHLAEHALLSFFWKKGEGKEAFLKLLQGIHQTQPKALKHPEVLNAGSPDNIRFLTEKYHASDFNSEPLGIHPAGAANDFLLHPEKLAFFATQDKFSKQSFPPIISYGSAKHSSLAGATYPDCGETSLRNFLNIALFNPDSARFDIKNLNSLKAKNPALNFNPNLANYYESHPDPALAASQDARDAWSETVASQHEGVNYFRPRTSDPKQCEINAGIDNLVSVLDNLLFHQTPASPLNRTKSRKDRLDALCEALSRDGFKLSWNDTKPKAGGEISDTGTDIELSVNGKPSFTWQFHPAHFALQELHQSTEINWKDQVGIEMAKQLGTHVDTHPHSESNLALHWVINEKNWDGVMKELPKAIQTEPEHASHFYALPLNSTDTKLFAFEKVVRGPLAKPMENFAKKLRSRVPQDDLRTQGVIHNALADGNYPYIEDSMQVEGHPDSLHALGKPDAIYTRVNPEKLAAKFGESAARTLGRTWAREMFSHSVAIGEPLLDVDGKDHRLKFEDAKKACLDLNSPDQREKVKAAFEAREAQLAQVRDDRTVTDEAGRQQRLNEIHKTNPIPGIYLMSKEEWKVLEGDLGIQDGKYIPQILPKLNNRYFWSSSGHTCGAGGAFQFRGHTSGVSYNGRNEKNEVRCGAAAW